MGTSVLIVLFFTVGFCFGESTDRQNLGKNVDHIIKPKFEDPKEESKNSIEKVAVDTIRFCDGIRPFRDCIDQVDSTGSIADLDDPEDDSEKRLDELKKQFEELSKELNRIPESEEFERFLKELERLQEDIKRGGESVKEKIKKEIIPRLKEEIEKFRERFLKPREREVGEPIEV